MMVVMYRVREGPQEGMSGKKGRLDWLELYGLIKLIFLLRGSRVCSCLMQQYTGMTLRWCKAVKGEGWAPPVICCVFINKGLLRHCPLWS